MNDLRPQAVQDVHAHFTAIAREVIEAGEQCDSVLLAVRADQAGNVMECAFHQPLTALLFAGEDGPELFATLVPELLGATKLNAALSTRVGFAPNLFVQMNQAADGVAVQVHSLGRAPSQSTVAAVTL